MKPIRITDRTILFTQPMGSLYSLNLGLIVTDHCNFLIDTGLGSGSVLPVLDFLSGNTNPIVVINTHHHWDHVWGNGMFSKGMILAHQYCANLMDIHWDESLMANDSYVDGTVVKTVPNTVFFDRYDFDASDIEVFYPPG
ncbi:MAG: MBL fold metallo-hydrolase, partial [Oscillospiraceae bacterium]|nr:MBL fold metallo-hydrolase [Oscillospiraceae bacterium]